MEEHPEARLIVDTLKEKGYIAYYAGGWVRDFLLQHPSDDIDIATDAPPEEIQKIFPKTVPIGLAFGIILVLIDGKQYEVATFRTDIDYKDGRRPSKVSFTNAKEDAIRRDFTINGMFYDPIKEEVIDFVGGKKDLENKIIRAIGDPHERIREDRLRMIRAVRFSCRFQFTIESKTDAAIRAHVEELFPPVAMERIVQEIFKMSQYPFFKEALLQLFDYGLLQEIFPEFSIKKSEMEKRVQHIPDFPAHLPIIAYLLELFPKIDEKKIEILCKHLKLSNQEWNFASFLKKAEKLLQKGGKDLEWVYFFASPLSQPCLRVFAARLDIQKREIFIKQIEKKEEDLLPFIKRVQEKTPVVTSSHLKEIGIQPGIEMGKLLKKAEEIAIEERIEDPKEVLQKLKE